MKKLIERKLLHLMKIKICHKKFIQKVKQRTLIQETKEQENQASRYIVLVSCNILT